jgi:lipopolysaccharide/colanic/teichoic acid biosynthesis glycosyltransferase/glycosyltransferase involved in cell wall biosynthesis
MHLLLIHQAFASPGEPGGTRHFEFGLRLVQSGHRFTAVASRISYLTGQAWPAVPRRPSPAESAAGWQEPQNPAELRVLRAYTLPAHHRSFAWRVASFVVFMFTSTLAGLWAGPLDLVMGTSPPIFQALSAWFVAVLRRRPYLLEIRDLWPEFAIDMGVLKNPLLIALSRRLERFLYDRATHLLVNSPAYRDYLLAAGVPAARISLIPNGADPDAFDPDDAGERMRHELGAEGKFVVTYAGALGPANDIPTLLRAADRLRNEPDIRFLLIGDGKARAELEATARERTLPNVTFTGPLSKAEIPEALAASDACVAILRDIPMFRTTYPNKVFDYMAAGRPTILAIDGAIRQVIEAAGGGICVPPGDDRALAEAVLALSRDRPRARALGRAARSFVVEHFNRHNQAAEFEDLVLKLAQRGPASPAVEAAEGTSRAPNRLYRSAGKRILDLTVSIPLLVLASPVLAVTGLLVRLRLGGPVLFRQRRPGLHGRPFTVLKFRTMADRRDAHGALLPDAERLTPFGRALRSTSLDELPELFNVVAGEMSLVGPRPLLMEYLDRYTPEQMRRHDVKPGITGWAQVNGRNALTWEQKFAFDVWYVDHLSPVLDLKILALTAWRSLKREGINEPGQATAQEFRGSSH